MTHTIKKTVITAPDLLMFDDTSSQWAPNRDYNLLFLKAQEKYYSDLLQARGYVFLNEVYLNLGMPATTEGCVLGWLKTDGYIQFEVLDKDDPTNACICVRLDGLNIIFDKL